jgi:hypothetical protein
LARPQEIRVLKEPSSLESIQSGIIQFLASPALTNGDGCIYSWVNPAHPGFVYPESMGLYLRLMSYLASERKDERLAARAHEIAQCLQRLTPPSGGVGMEGNLYLFDTCMAVAGLSAYRRLLNGKIDPAKMKAMAGFVRDMTERRLTLVDGKGRVPEAPHHWSTIYGAHQLKTVIALDCLFTDTGEAAYRSLALGVMEEIVSGCLKDGAFRIGPTDQVVYCHAHCYALEGLLYLRERGYRDTTAIVRIGADRLRDWQNEDGSMFNWYEDPSRTRSKVGDASAQAVRIWLAADPAAYRTSIDRGIAFLSGLRSPGSGLYYCTGSLDVNSVTSIFATQAMEWALRGARPEWLV